MLLMHTYMLYINCLMAKPLSEGELLPSFQRSLLTTHNVIDTAHMRTHLVQYKWQLPGHSCHVRERRAPS